MPERLGVPSHYLADIATAMEEMDVRKGALAKAVGVSKKEMSKILNGEVVPSPPMLKKIESALGIKLLSREQKIAKRDEWKKDYVL